MSEITVKKYDYLDLASVNLIDELEEADVIGLSVSREQAKLLTSVWRRFDSYKMRVLREEGRSV